MNVSKTIGILLWVLLFIFCAEKLEHDSIFDPDYDGDYKLELGSLVYDTLLTNAEYTFTFNTGRDSFSTILLHSPGSSIATVIRSSETSITVRFKESFTGSLVFSGMQHNKKTVDKSIDVTVLDENAAGAIPDVRFSESVFEVGKDESFTFYVNDSSGTSVRYIWRFKSGEPETTTVNFLTKQFTKLDTVTIYVAGVDKFNRTGSVDSAVVKVNTFAYQLSVEIPDIIKARDSALFKASVKENAKARFLQKGGMYYWVFSEGATRKDTVRTVSTTVRRWFHDSLALSVSVWVKDSAGESSPRVQKPVIIREFRPVLRFKNDSVVEIRSGAACTITVEAFDTDPQNGGVRNIHYDTDGDGMVDTITEDTTIVVTFNSGGLFYIVAYAEDKDGFFSKKDTLVLQVISDRPYFNPAASDARIYIDSLLTMRVHGRAGESGVSVVSYHWKISGADKRDTTTDSGILAFRFTNPGIDTVSVICEDRDGYTSDPDVFIVGVDSGVPIIDSIRPRSVWINHSVIYTISAVDPNDSIRYYYVQWEEGGDFKAHGHYEVTHRYTSDGSKQVRAYVVDHFGFSSDTLTDSIEVKLGRPKVNLEIPESVWYGDTVRCRVIGEDNDSIVKYGVCWNWNSGSKSFTVQRDSIFTHVYLDSGSFAVAGFVMDADNLTDTATATVRVKLGKPDILTIEASSDEFVYIFDEVTFTVTGFDENDSVKTIMASWDGDEDFEVSIPARGNRAVFTHEFQLDAVGTADVRFRVVDPDGLVCDSIFRIEVRSGAPVIDSVKPLVTWVNDTTTIKISASDVNGTIIKRWVDWGNDGVWNDSSSVVDTFSHVWDTTFGGENAYVRVKVMDNDSLTTTKLCSVFVRLGRPVVGRSSHTYPDSIQWMDGADGDLDTMFYRFSGMNTLVIVGANDTDGVVDSIFWYLNGSQTPNRKSSEKTLELLGKQSTKMTVRALDNNRLLSEPYTFWVYPDEPPPAPSLGAPTIQGDSVRLVWENADAKDGDSTHFQILCDMNNPPTTVIKEFGTCKKSGTEFYYWFKPPETGSSVRYRWRVRARDARGSEVNGDGTPYFDFP